MVKSLSPREAAQRLGITVETLRRWERDGLVASERTPGGQRRYREEEVLALLDEPEPRRVKRSTPVDNEQAFQPLPVVEAREPDRELPPWERRIHEERADLEVLKLKREKAALIRAEREEIAARKRSEERRERDNAESADLQRRAEFEAARERSRLDSLRSYGRTLAILAPPSYQALVAKDLLSFVTSRSVPAELDSFLAREHVRARVEEVLRPWREEEARKRERQEADRKRSNLISSGTWYARTQTDNWDPEDARDATTDVEEALREAVESDWTERKVRELVDDILADWAEP